MHNKLIIIGAGGHGRVVADIAEKTTDYEEILFLDDADISSTGKYRVIGKIADYENHLEDADFFVALGDNELRKNVFMLLVSKKASIPTFVHPSAIVADDVTLGKGTVVIAGAVINCGANIGDAVIINTGSSVDHDCIVGSYSHIAVGARITGEAKIGESVFIGANAVVVPDVSVCEGSIVGAGAVVIRNITKKGIYVGIPAKQKNN